MCGAAAEVIRPHFGCKRNLQWGGGGNTQHPLWVSPGRTDTGWKKSVWVSIDTITKYNLPTYIYKIIVCILITLIWCLGKNEKMELSFMLCFMLLHRCCPCSSSFIVLTSLPAYCDLSWKHTAPSVPGDVPSHSGEWGNLPAGDEEHVQPQIACAQEVRSQGKSCRSPVARRGSTECRTGSGAFRVTSGHFASFFTIALEVLNINTSQKSIWQRL